MGNFLRDQIDKIKPNFEKGGKLEKLYYPFEALETFLFVPNETTGEKGAQIKDAFDLKRMMMTVIIAMIPCLIFGMWNTGYQHHLATGQAPGFWEQFGIGARLVIPIVIVSYAVGLGIEFVSSIIRKHPINEGYLVSGMLIPLIMPATIPLWQVALGTAFAVIIGKEVFGGTGMNILNIALTARVFLYFAYPGDISGDVWTYLGDAAPVDGYTGATALAIAAETTNASVVEALNNGFAGMFTFENMALGLIPGSIGETSAILALVGAFILIVTGVGSWRIILAVFAGTWATGLLFNLIGGSNFLEMPAHYHLVMGGLAFGAVFMATDPVSASQTLKGQWIYGILIGVVTVIIRVTNPAYPEGIMLAILLMNVFAPLIDHYVVQGNKKRRLQRATV